MDIRSQLTAICSPAEDAADAIITSMQAARQRNEPHFKVRCVLDQDDGTMRVDMAFFMLDGEPDYTLDRYKAVLLPTIHVEHSTINGVNLQDLEQRMAAIPWMDFPLPDNQAGAGPLDAILNPASAVGKMVQQNGLLAAIEQVCRDMVALGQSTAGTMASAALQTKYFSQTPFMRGSSYQKKMDLYEELTGRYYIFADQEQPIPSFAAAHRMLKGELPLPGAYMPRIFQLSTEKVGLSYFMQDDSKPPGDYHIRYFRSLQKAYDHAGLMDERLFFPTLVEAEGLSTAIRHITISEEFNNHPIASKLILGGDLNDGSATLGWMVHQKYYDAERFYRQINRPTATLIHYQNDPSKIVVTTESDFKISPHQQRPGERQKRKGRDGGQGYWLN